ncbi:MAG: UDP-N-acetylmuramate dehydrogenase [Candidatus Zixiibacteriota bacterium]|nr:MAG: UDP-N-acetylmuramate dehydrogenase [candidate division Zixibacteria bacterium]
MVGKSAVSPNIPRSTVREALGPKVQFDRPLAPLTSYRTGGPAKYFIPAGTPEELTAAVTAANRLRIPFFIIGGGSNLLVSDRGYDGLIIRVEIRGMNLVDETVVTCGAGEDLMALVNFAAECSLTGLEFAAGIWGTVGGALYGNAGAYGGEMKDIVRRVTLVDSAGYGKTVDNEYCRFGYRDSCFKVTGDIIIEATFQLRKGDKVAIGSRVDEILALRARRHPGEGNSAGCFFKNIPDPDQEHGKLPAGRLLEEAGVKGLSVGGAAVYPDHANIIVNTGHATSKDIRDLADIMKEKVREKFAILLEEEVIQLGEF